MCDCLFIISNHFLLFRRDVREISGVYELEFNGNIDAESFSRATNLVVDSFNALRTDICSSQVVEVSVLSEAEAEEQSQAQTRQSSGSSVIVEVVTVSARNVSDGAFSADGVTEDAFLKQLNNELASFGSTSFVETVGFVRPSVRCTANRATYSVELDIEYTSDSPLACQGTCDWV